MQTLRSLRCIVLFYTRSPLIRENRELLPKRGFPAVRSGTSVCENLTTDISHALYVSPTPMSASCSF